jgi:VanZ family protein
MRKLIKHYWENNARLTAWLITLFITVGSLVNTRSIPVPKISISDKMLHSAAYMILTWSWLFVYRKKNKPGISIYIFSSIMLFGMILEVFQGISGMGRTADWKDIAANTTGSILAILMYPAIEKYLYRN